jgi:hypothetical protein
MNPGSNSADITPGARERMHSRAIPANTAQHTPLGMRCLAVCDL